MSSSPQPRDPPVDDDDKSPIDELDENPTPDAEEPGQLILLSPNPLLLPAMPALCDTSGTDPGIAIDPIC